MTTNFQWKDENYTEFFPWKELENVRMETPLNCVMTNWGKVVRFEGGENWHKIVAGCE